MPYISNKKRNGLIRKINKSYTFRKVIIAIEVILLVAFLAVAFFSFYNTVLKGSESAEAWTWFVRTGTGKIELTQLGWIMVSIAIAIVALGIISLLLIFTMKSPKDVAKQVDTLESSALSGKSLKNNETVQQVVKARKTKKARK